MAAELENASERTHEPTALQHQRARRRGQTPRSAELNAAVVILSGAVVIALLGPALTKAMTGMIQSMLMPAEITELPSAGQLVGPVLACLWPLAVAVVAAAVIANFAQSGFNISTDSIKPEWNRLSLMAGLGRLLSIRMLERLALSLVKCAAIGGLIWWAVADSLPRIASSGRLGPEALLAQAGQLAIKLTAAAGVVLLGLGLLDYLYQRWQHGRDLRMTEQQVQQDMKQMEGDPILRARRRQRAKEIVVKNSGGQVVLIKRSINAALETAAGGVNSV